jgi:superfamily I DNA/RNA helicase
MKWDTNLLPDQKNAVCKYGCHICVLAGPGTGKTLTLTRRYNI